MQRTSNHNGVTCRLSPETSELHFGAPVLQSSARGRILITACLHGNEKCGLWAINELIDEGGGCGS